MPLIVPAIAPEVEIEPVTVPPAAPALVAPASVPAIVPPLPPLSGPDGFEPPPHPISRTMPKGRMTLRDRNARPLIDETTVGATSNVFNRQLTT